MLVANRMRRVGRPRALVDADRAEAAGLKYPHQLQANHLEQREKSDDEAAAVVDVGEQIVEAARFGFRQARQQLLDADFDRNLLGREQHLRPQPGALHHRLERGEQAEEIDLQLRLVVVSRDVGDAAFGTLPLRRAQLLALVQQAGRGSSSFDLM